MKVTKIALKFVLFGLAVALRAAIAFVPAVRRQAAGRDAVIQIRTKNNSVGRWFAFTGGKLRSDSGIHPEPDGTLLFKNPQTALLLLLPFATHFDFIAAIKGFRLDFVGQDEVTSWFTDLVSALMTCMWRFGIDEGNGERRFINPTNGGPVTVSVEDGKIVRLGPIMPEKEEAERGRWTIRARGKVFHEHERGKATAVVEPLQRSRFTGKLVLA